MNNQICRDCALWEREIDDAGKESYLWGKCRCEGQMLHPVGFGSGRWITGVRYYKTQFNYGCVNWTDEPEESGEN